MHSLVGGAPARPADMREERHPACPGPIGTPLAFRRAAPFAVHSKKVDAIPNIKTLPEQGATSKFFTVSGFSGWAVPKATPQPIVDRLSELCVAANNDPKVKEVLTTFVLEPAIGFQESNALYQKELPVWLEAAKSLGIEPA